MAKKKKDTNKDEMLPVMQFRPPKLKDMPRERSRVRIDCKEQFGFLPEVIIIDKEYGKNNRIIISAVVPSSKLKRESNEDN